MTFYMCFVSLVLKLCIVKIYGQKLHVFGLSFQYKTTSREDHASNSGYTFRTAGIFFDYMLSKTWCVYIHCDTEVYAGNIEQCTVLCMSRHCVCVCVCVWMGGWVGGWVGSWVGLQRKFQSLHLMKMICILKAAFYLNMNNLLVYDHGISPCLYDCNFTRMILGIFQPCSLHGVIILIGYLVVPVLRPTTPLCWRSLVFVV